MAQLLGTLRRRLSRTILYLYMIYYCTIRTVVGAVKVLSGLPYCIRSWKRSTVRILSAKESRGHNGLWNKQLFMTNIEWDDGPCCPSTSSSARHQRLPPHCMCIIIIYTRIVNYNIYPPLLYTTVHHWTHGRECRTPEQYIRSPPLRPPNKGPRDSINLANDNVIETFQEHFNNIFFVKIYFKKKLFGTFCEVFAGFKARHIEIKRFILPPSFLTHPDFQYSHDEGRKDILFYLESLQK